MRSKSQPRLAYVNSYADRKLIEIRLKRGQNSQFSKSPKNAQINKQPRNSNPSINRKPKLSLITELEQKLNTIFDHYSEHAERTQGKQLKQSQFIKLCKDSKIIEGRLKSEECDLMFVQISGKTRQIDFSQFLLLLSEISNEESRRNSNNPHTNQSLSLVKDCLFSLYERIKQNKHDTSNDCDPEDMLQELQSCKGSLIVIMHDLYDIYCSCFSLDGFSINEGVSITEKFISFLERVEIYPKWVSRSFLKSVFASQTRSKIDETIRSFVDKSLRGRDVLNRADLTFFMFVGSFLQIVYRVYRRDVDSCVYSFEDKIMFILGKVQNKLGLQLRVPSAKQLSRQSTRKKFSLKVPSIRLKDGQNMMEHSQFRSRNNNRSVSHRIDHSLSKSVVHNLIEKSSVESTLPLLSKYLKQLKSVFEFYSCGESTSRRKLKSNQFMKFLKDAELVQKQAKLNKSNSGICLNLNSLESSQKANKLKNFLSLSEADLLYKRLVSRNPDLLYKRLVSRNPVSRNSRMSAPEAIMDFDLFIKSIEEIARRISDSSGSKYNESLEYLCTLHVLPLVKHITNQNGRTHKLYLKEKQRNRQYSYLIRDLAEYINPLFQVYSKGSHMELEAFCRFLYDFGIFPSLIGRAMIKENFCLMTQHGNSSEGLDLISFCELIACCSFNMPMLSNLLNPIEKLISLIRVISNPKSLDIVSDRYKNREVHKLAKFKDCLPKYTIKIRGSSKEGSYKIYLN